MNRNYKSYEIEKIKEYAGEEIYRWLRQSGHICVPLENQAYLFSVELCKVRDFEESERIVLYCGEDCILFSDYYQLLPEEKGESSFSALVRFLDYLTASDMDALDLMEDSLSALEEEMITAKKLRQETGATIVSYRRTLLRLKRSYEQLSAAADMLALDEAEIIPKNLYSRFAAISHRVGRLEAAVAHLRECTTQIREAYQAQIDIEQNQIMKIFTVLTAVFMPLSLIVGWYGMNFQMPEYRWSFGYPLVILFSIVVCSVTAWIFKKKNWY